MPGNQNNDVVLTPYETIELGVGTLFLPGRGTVRDGFVNGYFAIGATGGTDRHSVRALPDPSYLSGSHHNTSGWLELAWYRDLHIHR